MSDLIERLRSCARWGTMTSEFEASDRIEWIAADEIERLRRELAEARDLLREARPSVYYMSSAYPDETRLVTRIDAALALGQPDSERRPCSCPDRERPIPCPRKFALGECQKAADEIERLRRELDAAMAAEQPSGDQLPNAG
jgi:HAMP domain-containing protein